MNRSKIETETTITMNCEEKEAILGTCNPVWIKKMQKIGIMHYRKDGDWHCYKIDKKLVSVRAKRVLTEVQKLAAFNRGKALSRRIRPSGA